MIEYPSIAFSSKAPRKKMVAFDKLDGSNFRAKWSPKKGFHVFGTRTQLIDESTEFWGDMVKVFKARYAETLDQLFRETYKPRKRQRPVKEIAIFGEYFGPNSFAGQHHEDDLENDLMDIVFFDVLIGKRERKFLLPYDFLDLLSDRVPVPEIVYEGNLTDEFIRAVKASQELTEGVICKGLERSGAYRGNVWMCKIKTDAYIEKLKAYFHSDWEKYL